MVAKPDARSRPFNPALVCRDLETHPELWDEVLFEHQIMGHFGDPKTTRRQTYYFILPAPGWEASMMELAARWYPEHLGWFDSPNGDRQILIATWNE